MHDLQESDRFWQIRIRNLKKHPTHPIVICAVDVSRHAKVPNFNHELLPHQTVASSQVPVDKVQGRQVDHPRRDLSGDVKHLLQRERPQRRQLGLLQDVSVGTVSSASSNRRKRFSCAPEDLLLHFNNSLLEEQSLINCYFGCLI